MQRSHVLRVFMACLILSWSVGCRDTATEPQRESPPMTASPEILRLQSWIDRVDPFVSQNNDGTFTFDNVSFIQQYPNLTPADATLVEGLRQLIASTTIPQGGKGGDECEWAACWNWWWGSKCCFTGREASQIIAIAVVGGLWGGPLATAVLGSYAAVMQYYKDVYGGFCIYQYRFYPFYGYIAITPLR